LRLLDEEQSLRLLGLTDATELGEGGWLILRLAGRRPLQPDGWSPLTLRGVRVPSEELSALIQQLIDAWSGPAPAGEAAPNWLSGTVPSARPPEAAAPDRTLAGDNWGEEAHVAVSTANAAAHHGEAGEKSPPGTPAARGRVREADVHEGAADGRDADDDPRPFQLSQGDAREAASASAVPVDETLAGVHDPVGATNPARPLIRVRCFGHLAVRHGDRLLDPAAGDRATYKAWELLAFLAASPPGPVARDTLLDRLWADRPLNPRRPANVLNHAVSRLRRALIAQVPDLPADIVRFGRDGTYRLNPALVTSDVHRFLSLAEGWARLPLAEALDAHREACALYREELLAGTGYAWVHERHGDAPSLPERYQAEVRDFTLGLARRCVREERTDLAAPLYRGLLDAEPTREDFARELYRVYGALGDRRALVRAHRALRQALHEDTDGEEADDDPVLYEPEEETEETFRQVLATLDGQVVPPGRRVS
jgi:two-component SAPR family response regulator